MGITLGLAAAISSMAATVSGLSTTALASAYRLCFEAKKMEHSLDGNNKKKGEYNGPHELVGLVAGTAPAFGEGIFYSMASTSNIGTLPD